jgi:hypothetical protein
LFRSLSLSRFWSDAMTILIRSDRELVADIAEDIRVAAFHAIDSHPDATGDDAGRIAAKVEKLVRDELTELFAVEE